MKCNDRYSELKTRKGLGVKVDHSKQEHIPASKLRAGDVSRRIPVKIDDKTTVYCKPGSDLNGRREFWERQINKI